jgi:hypothetical protein
MVLARPVTHLALYDETRLAAAVGLTVDRTTGCLYQPWSSGSPRPTYVAGLTQSTLTQRCNQWVQGDTDLDGKVEWSGTPSNITGTPDQPAARLYSIDRNTAALRQMEVQK